MDVENQNKEIAKETNPKKKHFIIPFLIVSVMIIVGFILFKKYDLKGIIETKYFNTGLSIESVSLDHHMISISFSEPTFPKKRWYQALSEDGSMTEWLEVSSNNQIEADEAIKYLHIKDEKQESGLIPITDYCNTIYELNVKTTLDKIMLTKGEKKELEIEIKCIGNPNKELSIVTDDPSVLQIDGQTLTALEPGKVTLTVSDSYGHKVEIPVTVTDLITLPQIDKNKKFLNKANVFTQEEAHLLDELLEYKVKEAGEGTRAAVVAVAKFMTMEFPYRVPYIYENGRYQENDYSRPCDGEGRWYHKGLYLSEDKYETIKDSRAGPALWGEPINELSTGIVRPNGLDCSGFVSFALYNAGFDPGDIGAGPDDNYATIPGYGVEYDLTVDILRSGIIKDGDIITWWGHVGIIEDIDLENETITVSDTVFRDQGLCANQYTFNEVVYETYFSKVYDFSKFYGEE